MPLLVFMFVLGVHPGLVLDKVDLSIQKVLAPLEAQLVPQSAAGHAAISGGGEEGAPAILLVNSDAEDLR